MKVEFAKSLERNEIITAEKSDFYFQNGVISSKFNFECADDKCTAQITCANLDKPLKLRKRDPYYIYVENHADDCKIKQQIELEERPNRIKLKGDSEDLPFLGATVATINLTEASNTVQQNTNSSSNSTQQYNSARKSTTNSNDSSKRKATKRLSAWVEAFCAQTDISMELPDGLIHITDLFININNSIDIHDLPDEPRIYHGKAWVNKLNPTTFLIRFNNSMQTGQQQIRPTFFLGENLLEASKNRLFSYNTLSTIAEAKKPVIFYIFSMSGPTPKSNNKGEAINFYIQSLSYLYYT